MLLYTSREPRALGDSHGATSTASRTSMTEEQMYDLAVADAEGVENFHLMAYSGGSPHAVIAAA